MNLPTLSLYIHVPWCIRKCPYCDFNSHKADEQLPEKDYLNALIADLQQDLIWVKGRDIQSVFIGGGTPSLLSAEFYTALFSRLNEQLTFAPDAEITMEANPGSFEAAKFADYRSLGINRLSIGIQSFNPVHLEGLGRVHDRDQALNAVKIAQQAGFQNFNLDLMHGLPKQTPEQALADLSQALSFSPPHLSWYQLTIEPNTEFYSQPPVLPHDETLWDIQEAGQALLAQQGFEHYEISAFCQPGQHAKHNLNYWSFGDYIGIGAGAHGKFSYIDQGELKVVRSKKTRQPKYYLQRYLEQESGAPLKVVSQVAKDELAFECLMNALRLDQGISLKLFEQRTGLSISAIDKPIKEAQRLGLLDVSPNRISPSTKGKLYLNELLGLFL